jgi:hypothetical protein
VGDGVQYPEMHDGGEPVGTPGVAPDPYSERLVGAPPVATLAPPQPNRSHRVGLAVAAVAVLVVAAVGIILGTTSASHTSSTAPSAPAVSDSPDKVVLTAIDSALGAKTADLQMTVEMTISGTGQVTASGQGVEDFTNHAAQIEMAYHGLKGLDGVAISVRYTDGGVYLSIPTLGTLLPGKSWISESVAGSSLTPGSSNPSSLLQILQSAGDQVTPLGPSVVDGAPVHGYHVVIPEAAIQQRLRTADLPAGVAQTAQSMYGPGGITTDVFVNDANGLLRRVQADLDLTIAGHAVTGKVVEDTSNYGVPVTVTAPPAGQVASFQQFEQAASAVSGNSSTSG